jgi:hypothetical protein
MTIKITNFADIGTLEKERVVLKVLSDDDIGEYVLLVSRRHRSDDSNDISASSGPQIAFWFPDQTVKAGEFVVLYSKAGVSKSKALPDGRVGYFYYFGKSKTLWGDNSCVAVLLHASQASVRGPDPEIFE